MNDPTIIGTSTLYNCDCLEAMRQMPDKSFSLAIVDPPYGIDIMHGGGQPASSDFTKWERKDWDKSPPPKEYFTELKRVSQNQIVWGGNYFTEHLEPSQCWLIWDKMQRNFTFADFEMAWTSFDKASKAFNMSRASAYTNQIKIHPTQKPAKLYQWMLQNYAKEGDTILDTHLGSGSHAIACNDMGFDLTAYEIDVDYFKAACERIDNAAKQYKLAL